jgi:hypothetical protein
LTGLYGAGLWTVSERSRTGLKQQDLLHPKQLTFGDKRKEANMTEEEERELAELMEDER